MYSTGSVNSTENNELAIDTSLNMPYNGYMGKARLYVVILVAALLFSGWQPTRAQSASEQYFHQTGHWVTGEFLQTYLAAGNPLLVYGYPITEAYQDTTSNLLIQYFEKARFELHPELMPGQRVRLFPLGENLYEPGQGLPVPPSAAACRLFPETGFEVCYSFLDFFNANGGVLQFGYPISNIEQKDGRMVQWFQNARMEWRPDLPTAQRVAVSNLGRLYFDRQDENPQLLFPVPGDGIIKGVLRMNVRAYPARPVTAQKGRQTVYVTVQDQRLMPVSNAQVTIIVSLPNQQEVRQSALLPTNNQGQAQITFPFDSSLVGLATIRVVVSKDGLTSTTLTSFRIWY